MILIMHFETKRGIFSDKIISSMMANTIRLVFIWRYVKVCQTTKAP